MVVDVSWTHVCRLCDVVNAFGVANEVQHATLGLRCVEVGVERQKYVRLSHPAWRVPNDERQREPNDSSCH
jgi:hypothetical protein